MSISEEDLPVSRSNSTTKSGSMLRGTLSFKPEVIIVKEQPQQAARAAVTSRLSRWFLGGGGGKASSSPRSSLSVKDSSTEVATSGSNVLPPGSGASSAVQSSGANVIDSGDLVLPPGSRSSSFTRRVSGGGVGSFDMPRARGGHSSAAGASATPSAPKRPSSDLPSGPSAPQQAAAPTVPGVAAVGAAGRGRLLRRNSSSLPCTYESEILQQGLATAGGQSFTAPAPLASALLRSASNASTAVSGKGGLPQAAASGAVQGSGGSFSSVHTSGDSFSSGARIRRGSTGSYGFPRHAAAATATDATMHASDDSDEASSPKVRTPALQGDIAELASRMGAAEHLQAAQRETDRLLRQVRRCPADEARGGGRDADAACDEAIRLMSAIEMRDEWNANPHGATRERDWRRRFTKVSALDDDAVGRPVEYATTHHMPALRDRMAALLPGVAAARGDPPPSYLDRRSA